MQKTKLIILDFDGVLFNLTVAKIKTIHQLSRLLGLEINPFLVDKILNYINQIYEQEKILDYKKILKRIFAKLKKNKEFDITPYQQKIFSTSFSSYLEKNSHIDRRIVSLLNSLSKKAIKTCVYSSRPRLSIRAIIKKSKVNFRFDKIYGREDFDEPKPSIKNLKAICKDFGISPRNALMIGDNLVTDIIPAKSIGMRTILYSNSTDYLAKSDKELKDLLSKI